MTGGLWAAASLLSDFRLPFTNLCHFFTHLCRCEFVIHILVASPHPTPPHIESRKSHKTRRPPATALATTHLDMVYTTYIWWFGGWFIIVLTTLPHYDFTTFLQISQFMGPNIYVQRPKIGKRSPFPDPNRDPRDPMGRGSLCKCILLFLKLRVLKVPLVVFAHMDHRNAIWDDLGPLCGSVNAVDRHGAWRSFYITYSIHIYNIIYIYKYYIYTYLYTNHFIEWNGELP